MVTDSDHRGALLGKAVPPGTFRRPRWLGTRWATDAVTLFSHLHRTVTYFLLPTVAGGQTRLQYPPVLDSEPVLDPGGHTSWRPQHSGGHSRWPQSQLGIRWAVRMPR